MTLTTSQQLFYQENGYVLVPELLSSSECTRLRQEMHDIAAQEGHSDATWDSVRGENTALSHCHDVHFRSGAVTRLLTHSGLIEVAKDLIGPNVQLHHTKMFIKPPEKGSPFPMHQDFPYFPHRNHTMIAAIIHLDDAPVEKGCLRFYPGTHTQGPLPSFGKDRHACMETYPIDRATPVPARAGDVVFFHYLTVHGSGPNLSDSPRTTILIQMRDPSDQPLEDRHQSRGQGMMLAGIDPTAGKFHFAWSDAAR